MTPPNPSPARRSPRKPAPKGTGQSKVSECRCRRCPHQPLLRDCKEKHPRQPRKQAITPAVAPSNSPPLPSTDSASTPIEATPPVPPHEPRSDGSPATQPATTEQDTSLMPVSDSASLRSFSPSFGRHNGPWLESSTSLDPLLNGLNPLPQLFHESADPRISARPLEPHENGLNLPLQLDTRSASGAQPVSSISGARTLEEVNNWFNLTSMHGLGSHDDASGSNSGSSPFSTPSRAPGSSLSSNRPAIATPLVPSSPDPINNSDDDSSDSDESIDGDNAGPVSKTGRVRPNHRYHPYGAVSNVMRGKASFSE
ncbi:hypothetical protein PM082_023250 [Marasmius tenuissimus]|nr:hypothetical protein PM082_023250 [Marasmius tenuissimus]